MPNMLYVVGCGPIGSGETVKCRSDWYRFVPVIIITGAIERHNSTILVQDAGVTSEPGMTSEVVLNK